ncbi:tol-pal system protein YbgF [Candidatus Profftia tarda]|uniref:Cell division coordinator CpoB n=1 Tax=Candidatus Profftia tarda TaxID=1177216 RepID=A0A8E4EYQ5_9ENTR|nr:tol-pal system protein YbgF [Candidatus Profftia tarda]CAD6509945.1 Uncharacterized protein YbgF [Candidatus Profftia tarda]
MSSQLRLHLLILLLCSAITVEGAAIAQAPISSYSSIDQRIASLEYTTNAQGQFFSQLQKQVSDNQHDIDLLRGQIQENKHKLNQVLERQQYTYSHLERYCNLQKKIADNNSNSSSIPNDNHKFFRSLSSAKKSYDDDIKIAYNDAIDLVMVQEKKDQAIASLLNFVKKYPNSAYQPNANYWIGQLFYNKGKKEQSAYYFALVVKNYPKSLKAPQAMYKIGIIMQETGKSDKAYAVYNKLIKQYPQSDSAKQAEKRIARL